MADPSLEHTVRNLHSIEAAAGSSSISMLGPAIKSLSSDASAMARSSLDLRELESANALNTLS